MRNYGLDPGTGDAVTNQSPLTSMFARVDLMLPGVNTRGTLIERETHGAGAGFTRVTANSDTFSLSSYRLTSASLSRLLSLQLHTGLGGGRYNALALSLRTGRNVFRPEVREPLVLVRVPATDGGTAVIKAGSREQGQGVWNRSRVTGLTETLTLPAGAAHEAVLGGQVEWVRLDRGGVNGGYGTWTFASLAAFDSGVADRYQISQDFGSAGAPIRAVQYGVFAGDEWRVGDRVSLNIGLRADVFALQEHAAYNPEVDRLFGRRTDRMPAAHIHWSPRVGFTWDPAGTGRDQLRGGVGVFTGRYPLAWAHTAVYSNGSGIGVLRCGATSDPGPAPAFVPDYRAAPTTCANGKGLATAPTGDVDVLDPNLRLPQSLRGSLAWERQFPGSVTSTAEVMVTRGMSDFVFENLRLAGPQGVDQHGRRMYGTVDATGALTPTLIGSQFPEVIDLRNVSASHAFQFDLRLERRFSRAFTATSSYTFSRVRDVGLPVRSGMAGRVNWMSQRVVSGLHDEWPTGASLYDIPHRVILAGAYTAPWRRWKTDVSLYYVGESGSPFTYVAGGDLNGDGAANNDPLYIPTSASDTNQIRFVAGAADSPGAQQQAFEQLIGQTRCLRRQRGQIMQRNSCREPWSHTAVATVRQAVPQAGRHSMTLQMDVFNVLNLLNSRWGRYRVADLDFASPALLSRAGQTPGPLGVTQPIFRFDTGRPRWFTLPTESSYQLQLALRYAF